MFFFTLHFFLALLAFMLIRFAGNLALVFLTAAFTLGLYFFLYVFWTAMLA